MSESRRLLLIRHAEAAHGPIDAERPLTERGAGDAAAMGAFLAQAGVSPDRVLVSPARRAVQTWQHAGAALPPGPEPTVDPRIYDNSPDALWEAIRDVGAHVRTLVLVGHNPSVAELAHLLDDGEADPDARRALDAGVRTGSVALFSVGEPFPSIGPGRARLTRFVVPRA